MPCSRHQGATPLARPEHNTRGTWPTRSFVCFVVSDYATQTFCFPEQNSKSKIIMADKHCYVIVHHVGVMLKALMLSPLCFGSLFGFGGNVLVI